MRFAVAMVAVFLLVPSGCVAGGHSSNGAIAVKTIPPAGETIVLTVPSSSMEPTLHCARPGSECLAAVADRVEVREPAGRLERRDVIAFRTPSLAMIRCGAGGIFIKRVVGMPGDDWEERNGFVHIDGKKLEEPYVPSSRRDTRTIAPVRIPPTRYFVLGDNRASSCDSRSWGSVPKRNVLGKVVGVLRRR